ncbi:MAG: hypothetical protein KA138_02335 [Saprospiraceae bacterium]|nr:hypothetical protein [Saprospiraceae bacterium]
MSRILQASMEQSQIIELIGTLTSEEKDQIRHFASNPVFNQGKLKEYVPRLLDICLSYSQREHKNGLEKKSVFAMLFPDQSFIEGKLEKIMVEAYKVVRKMLTVSQYLQEENVFQQNFDYSKVLRRKGLAALYLRSLTRLQKMQLENPYKTANFFYQQFLLETAIHDEECFNNQVKGDLNIPNVLHALDIFAHLNRLALLNRYLLQQKAAKVEVPDALVPQLEECNIPEIYLKESPSLRANFAVFNLLKKDRPDTLDIRTFYEMLQRYEQNLDKESLQQFYTYLRNLCILVSAGDYGNEEIALTLHDLYKDNLTRGYLHYEGKLHPSRYWAVTSNAIRVKDFDWAIDFIEKNKLDLIGENETQDIYRLNLANYLFGVGRFPECLDNIPASSPFVDYLLRGKCLEIKAYYELKSDLLSFKLEAFKVFLSRTSPKLLSDTNKQIHSDFANLLHQIINSLPGDPKRSDLLLKRIQEKKQAAEWRWLLEKAKALKSG